MFKERNSQRVQNTNIQNSSFTSDIQSFSTVQVIVSTGQRQAHFSQYFLHALNNTFLKLLLNFEVS